MESNSNIVKSYAKAFFNIALEQNAMDNYLTFLNALKINKDAQN